MSSKYKILIEKFQKMAIKMIYASSIVYFTEFIYSHIIPQQQKIAGLTVMVGVGMSSLEVSKHLSPIIMSSVFDLGQ